MADRDMDMRGVMHLLMNHARQENEEGMRCLAELLPFIVFETDRRGRFTYMNGRAMEVWGFDEKDMREGVYALDRVAPESRDAARKQMESVLRGRTARAVECAILHGDGSTSPFLCYSAPMFHDAEIVGARGVLVANLSGSSR